MQLRFRALERGDRIAAFERQQLRDQRFGHACAATSDGKNDGLSCVKISCASACSAIGDTALSVIATIRLPCAFAACATRVASCEYGAKLTTTVTLCFAIVRSSISSEPATPLSSDTVGRNSR